MIDPKRKLWKWGPIDGQILYIDYFMEAMLDFQTHTGIGWSDALTYFHKEKVIFVSDYEKLYNHGKKMFEKYLLDDAIREKNYAEWDVVRKKLDEFIGELNQIELSKQSEEELKKTIQEAHKLYDEFWKIGLIPEVANFGGENLLKEQLKGLDKKSYIEVFEALTTPTGLSFYQKEELDLLKVKQGERSLTDHQKKYYWIRNHYGKVSIADENYFQEELDKINEKEVLQKIKKIEEYTCKVQEKKEAIIKKHKIDEKTSTIAQQLSFSIWWQDYRKEFIFKALHAVKLIAQELGRRHKIPFEELLHYSRKDILELSERGKKMERLKEKKDHYISYYDAEKNECRQYLGKEAQEIISSYLEKKVVKEQESVTGMVVSKGKTQGKVRILTGARHFDSFKEGEVLVTAMTSPEYIVAMRKASAIVTDEGGMTCHAAIVSRELSTPCIVGTRVATHVFKTGDLVEVDAEKGIVRKITM